MTAPSDDQVQVQVHVRVGRANQAGPGGPHFLTPGEGRSGGSTPPTGARGSGRRPIPPWRRVARKGLLLGALVGAGFLIPPDKGDAQRVDADAAAERASFDVAEGFEVNLFAADPLLAKPTQINFDARGRLWVACSEAYPQVKPDEPANDKVVVLTDGDGDGVAERAEVFADGLLIPTGVEPGDGGAYVAQGTELLHIRDADGDGRGDERRVVLSGFGTEDTHHIIHTLRWGPEGALYFNQSIYIHSHVETPWGVQHLAGGGIWRLEPDSQWLSVFARGWVNPWGHAFDRWGRSFVTDGAGGQGINHAIPGGAYTAAVGVRRVLPGLNPGSPKFCGAEILSGRHLPESARGDILASDFRANNVRQFRLGGEGSSFRSTPTPDLIRTRYQAFRPVDIKMGPDGAIYVADWYNPIINHGEVDFRDPRRDHTRGRIWRVTAKGRPLVERPRLVDAGVPQLLDALKAPEDWTRQAARRVLKERGRAAVEAALLAWAAGLDPVDPETEHHRLEALWVAEAVGLVAPALLDPVLQSRSADARGAGVRTLAHWLGRIADPFPRLAERAVDPDPRVRLEAVRALGSVPEPRGAEIALRALDLPTDPTLEFALAATLRDTEASWHPALADGRFDYGNDPRRLVFALEAVGSRAGLKPLIAALRAGQVGAGELDRARALIATLGDPDDLAPLLDLALDPATPPAQRAGLLAALADAATRRQVQPAGDLGRVGGLLADGADPALEVAAVRLVGAWRFEPLRARVEAIAAGPTTPLDARSAAFDALALLGGEAAAATLDRLAGGPDDDPRSLPAAARLAAAATLARLDPARAAGRAVAALALLPAATPEANLVPPLEAFIGRAGGADALTAALAGATLDPAVAEASARVATRLGGGTETGLAAALGRAGGLGSATGRTSWPAAERALIVRDVPRLGDPARGEAVFRRARLQCLGCHAIAGAGGRVGPGLESLGASAPIDYLVDSLVEPSKAVKEGYHATTVATADGRVVTGIRVGQTDTALLLRDAEDREISIPLAAIDEQKGAGSLMPAGLVDGLSRAELVDLVRFLGELGKLGPYAVAPQVRAARRWEVAAGSREMLPPSSPLDRVARDASLTWSPAYSTVAGLLPLADLPRFATSQGPVRLARTEIEATTGGAVRLVVASPDHAAWLDDRRLEPAAAERTVTLTPGVHRVTIAVPAADPAPLRLELRDAPGSPAQARPVLGK